MSPGRPLVLALLLVCAVGCRSRPDPEPALYAPDPAVGGPWAQAIGNLEQGERMLAIVPLRTVLECSPRFVKAHLLYQDAMIAIGKSTEVEAEYVRERERSGLALALYARVTTRGSRVALLEQAVAREPECAWTRYALGFERLRLLDLEPARVQLDHARELGPELAEAWEATARLRMRRFDPAGAAHALEQYLRLCPLDAVHWFKLGTYFHSIGDTEGAVRAYRRVTQISPDELTAAIRRRDVVLQEEQRRRFEPDCPVGYEAHLNLAEIRIRQGRIAVAIAQLVRAVALDETCPKAHYSLGIAYEQLGQAEAGRDDPTSVARGANYLEQAGHHWNRYLELGGSQRERVRGWLNALRERDSDPFGRDRS